MAEKDKGKGKGPIADNEAFSVDEDTTLSMPVSQLLDGDVLRNKHDTLTVTSVDGASHGAVSLTDGVVTYTPDPDYNGADAFSYTVMDDKGESGVGTVSITVSPMAEPVTARAIPASASGFTDGTSSTGGPIAVTNSTNPGPPTHGVVEFNVEGVPAQITSATLNLTAIEWSGVFPAQLDVFIYQGNGSVDTTDYGVGLFHGYVAIFNPEDTGRSPHYSVDLDESLLNSLLTAPGDMVGFKFRYYWGEPHGVTFLGAQPGGATLDLVW